MRILFFNRMLGVAWGGGENYDYHLARELQAMGHEVAFVTGRIPGAGIARPDLGIETIAVETPYLRRFMYELGGKVPLLPGALAELDLEVFRRRVFAGLGAALGGRRFDIAQVLSLPRLAAALLERGWRVAMRFPGPPAWFQGPFLTRLARKRALAMFSHGDTVRQFRERWRIEIGEIPPGIRTDVYAPPDEGAKHRMRACREVGRDAFVIFSAGRLVPGKGQDHLISAMPAIARQVPGAVLVLAGDGPLRPVLERKAESLGIGKRVRFAGQLDQAGVAGWLAASDVFSLCSDYENYSNAVLEAMSVGLPVIATRVGGFPLQVRDGDNGLLVGRADPTALADAVAALAGSAERRARMGWRGREFASRFSWRVSAERAERIYGRLLA